MNATATTREATFLTISCPRRWEASLGFLVMNPEYIRRAIPAISEIPWSPSARSIRYPEMK